MIQRDIFCTKDVILNAVDKLDELLYSLKNKAHVYCHKKTIANNLNPMKFIIMDLEGTFTKLCGLLIHNTLFQFYIKDEQYQDEFSPSQTGNRILFLF